MNKFQWWVQLALTCVLIILIGINTIESYNEHEPKTNNYAISERQFLTDGTLGLNNTTLIYTDHDGWCVLGKGIYKVQQFKE